MARKILLADDSVTAQNMGRKILSDAGYDVATVNNGSAALKRVAEHKPDLIVLDVYMPGYSGLEVCQRLKDSPETADIPILLTVGKLEPFKPEEARRVRAEAYIVKPFEASELLSVLTRLEDQVVPAGKNGKSESHGDTETGWKNRLRFPAKKKKEEPEPEPDMDFTAGTAAARSSRRGKTPGPEAVPAAGKAIPDIPRDITPEELDALSALAAKLDTPQNAAPNEAKKEFEVEKPAVEEQSVAAPAMEAPPAAAEESKAAAEIPADKAAHAVEEAKQPELKSVNVGELAEKEAAPVDREDEPIFSAAQAATEPIAAEPEAPNVEAKEIPPAAVEASTAAEAVEPGIVQAKPVPAETEEAKVEEVPASAQAVSEEKSVEPLKVEAPVSSATSTPSHEPPHEQQEPVPSEEELAEALRLLTPATVESSSARAEATLAVGGSSSAAGQWTAVAVALDPAEAACSLEAEMFKTLGTPAAISEPAASAATVEGKSTAMAAAAAASSSGSSTVAATPAASIVEHLPAGSESKEKIAEETVGDEQAPATFADAVGQTDEPLVAGSTVTETAGKDSQTESDVPVAETATATSNAAAGVEEDMGNERKNKKSNSHQNRSTEADAVETAKQVVAEEAKKAMAAAAQSAAADSAAIANIVDSVLADLRPKIVEEISKKLSRK